jgi:hypothetical protein
MKNKIEDILPLPLQLDTINIDHWGEEGGTCSSGRGGPAEGTASAPSENIKR